MTSGLNFGARASMPHAFGICLGFPSMFFAIGFGLGFLFERYAILHSVIQVFGILYLLYLSWLIANSGQVRADKRRPKPLSFVQAALFQWINPKAWVTATSAIAAFTTVNVNLNFQIITIGFILFCISIPSVGVWMLFGTALQRFLSDPRKLKLFNWTMAILLVVSVTPVIAELVVKSR